MDSYSGSEPRKFIFFHLGEEINGQPRQTSTENETEPPSEHTGVEADPGLTTIDTPIASTQPGELTGQDESKSPSVSLISRLFGSESSGSNESCGTYITCKMNQMKEAVARESAEASEPAGRESVSEIFLNPTVQDCEFSGQQVDGPPIVTFLDSPPRSAFQNSADMTDIAAKKPRVSFPSQGSGSEPLVQHSANPGVEATMTTVSESEKEQFSIQPPFSPFDDSENGLNTDTESSRQVGSTLPEALLLPSTTLLPQGESEYSDVSASDKFPIENQIPPLGGRSRALIKEYFAGN